jgi:hypothetical protein
MLTAPDAGSPGMMPAPVAAWSLFPVGDVSAIAIAGSSLYVIQGSPRGVYRTSLVGPPPFKRPSLVWSSASMPWVPTALAAWSSTLYVGAGSQIVAIDDASDAGATVLVDIQMAFPGVMEGPTVSLAGDGASIFWTQLITPSYTLMRHDLGTSTTAVTQMLVEGQAVALGAVAVDEVNAYTVMGMLGAPVGELDAVQRSVGGPVSQGIPVVPSNTVRSAAPLTAQGNQVYCVVDGAMGGQVVVGSPGAGSAVQFNSAPVDSYAIDLAKSWLFVGSGRDLLYSPLGQDSPQPLVATESSSTLLGIAVGSGYVAYFSADVLGIALEPP